VAVNSAAPTGSVEDSCKEPEKMTDTAAVHGAAIVKPGARAWEVAVDENCIVVLVLVRL
jgi:hypothetical protein